MLMFIGPSLLQKGWSQTDIRARLETVSAHTPWVVYMMMSLQAIAISIICSSAGFVLPRLSPQRLAVGELNYCAMHLA